MKQLTIRISDLTNRVLQKIAADGKFKSVNKLVESILFEIAIDEVEASDLTSVKKTSESSNSVSVA